MSPITNPQTAVAYLRVSTAQQVESGLGLEGQKAAIEDYAKKNHIEIVDWHTDGGVSGGADIEDRPGLVSAMSSVVQHRAGMLLVQKLDRLSRDTYTALTIERMLASSDARVVSTADEGTHEVGADAEFMRTLMLAMAAREKKIISGRIKVALAMKKARGERVGRPRRGFAVCEETGQLIKADDWEVVRDALVLRQTGQPWRVVGEFMGCTGQAAGVSLRQWKGGLEEFMRYTIDHTS